MNLSSTCSGDGGRRSAFDRVESGTIDRFRRPDLQELASPLSALSFWSAIALPLVYIPLLPAGIDSVSGLALFFGLFGLHVLALIGGHGHATSAEQ